MKLKSYKTIGILLLLLILLIPSIFFLLQPGFFESDDGEWMIIRFSAFYQALSDGQFPVRFLGRLNFGYGYPVANFLYPGFMYLATPLQALGLGFVNSIKLILIFSMLGGGIFTFKWLSKIFDEKSALIGAIFYTYTPYHLYDLYKRGSVGEILSLSILPFVLWQLERRSVFFTTVGIFLLILAHNTLAILFLFFIAFYMTLNIYVSKNRKDLISDYLMSVMLGTGMASFFWAPAFFELKYTSFSRIQISEWENYFAGINLIGLSTVIVFASTLVLIFSKKIKIGEHRLTLLLFSLGLASLFLSSSLSSIVWKVLPVSFIQFPFRFLSLTIPSIAFLAACAVFVLNGKSKAIVMVVLIISLFLSSVNFLTPSAKSDKGDSFYATNEATTTVKDEYLPKWVKNKPVSRFEEKVELLGQSQRIENLFYNSKIVYFETSSDTETKAFVNTIYYPGWQTKVNGVNTQIYYDNPKGIMEIKLPKGENKVEFIFSETAFRLFADFLSVFSFLALLIWTRKSSSNIISHSQILKKIRMTA